MATARKPAKGETRAPGGPGRGAAVLGRTEAAAVAGTTPATVARWIRARILQPGKRPMCSRVEFDWREIEKLALLVLLRGALGLRVEALGAVRAALDEGKRVAQLAVDVGGIEVPVELRLGDLPEAVAARIHLAREKGRR